MQAKELSNARHMMNARNGILVFKLVTVYMSNISVHDELVAVRRRETGINNTWRTHSSKFVALGVTLTYF